MSDSTSALPARVSGNGFPQALPPSDQKPEPSRDVGAQAKGVLDAMARTGDAEAFKSLLNAHSGSNHSVGGAGTGGIDIPWSQADEILARAGVDEPQRKLLRPTYERGLRAHFESRIKEARDFADKYEVPSMESLLEHAALHAKRAGVVTDITAKIDTFKRSVAQPIFDKALAIAKEATSDASVGYKLSGALGNMTAYGVLAGMTVAQVEAAKKPFMQTLVTQFGTEMTTFGGSVKRGYFQNHIKEHQKYLLKTAERTCANDPAMLKAAKAQINEATQACARATAMDYLKERDGVFCGLALIQAGIYARTGGLTGLFGTKHSAPGAEAYSKARTEFIKSNAANLPFSWACWKVVNAINFVRLVLFYM